MEERQIEIVQKSAQKVWPQNEFMTKIFYEKFFELRADAAVLFKGNIQSQGSMFVFALRTVVDALNNFAALRPVIKKMALNHAEYGVERGHYQAMGVALIYALEKCLGDEFSPEMKEAWTEAYRMLSEIMIKFANGLE